MDERALAAFEGKYGDGAFARLLDWLAQPCVTFAEIAKRFGVSRERVRQWHTRFLPDAPTGHARQRLCARHTQRRRLFSDPLFRTFFRHARGHFGSGRVQPIRSRSGYRARGVLIDGRLVALRRADVDGNEGLPAQVFRYRGRAEFVFVQLGEANFAFFPAGARHAPDAFRNSFAAFGELENRAAGAVGYDYSHAETAWPSRHLADRDQLWPSREPAASGKRAE